MPYPGAPFASRYLKVALCVYKTAQTLLLCLLVLEDEKLLSLPAAPAQLSGPFSKGSLPSLPAGVT